MVSLSNIAAELGVSTSLVSKVLNNRMGTSTVRPEIAEAIRAMKDPRRDALLLRLSVPQKRKQATPGG